jgi:enediyne biosynthesis protein E4
MKGKYMFLLLIFFGLSCNRKDKMDSESPLFTLKDNTSIGIDFSNNLQDTPDFNVYKYRNYYNGGGVAVGDINNDGLIDVYMVSNQNQNKLYLNKGNWQFEDITAKAGVGGTKSWSTGVTMVDINADGFLDIYVCNSGDIQGDNKENELFINNGDGTFTEKAAEYGLNDRGFSTHASFFDYDKDGDLDVYILNNSFRAIGSFDLKSDLRQKRSELGGDKLMENRNGKFVDVSEEAGIYGSEIGFGLGITIGDVDNDGWDDIFISNDFFERDYLYINQQNGKFKEVGTERMQAFSAASMGADIADINNDGWNDLFVTDMLPSDYSRLKTVTTFEDWNRNMAGLKNSFHYQYTRNCLHLNRGDGYFSEISRLAGVEASDWSWGALFFDMENDGHKDLFIANGIYKDLTNQDYLQYIANENVMKSIVSGEGVDYAKLIDIIPSEKVPNHAFKNTGNLYFEKYTSSGLWTESFSNGSAYADLDNDGDLDLIVNNVNMPCFLYENQASSQTQNNYLKLTLKGIGQNINAIGARVHVSTDNNTYTYENQPARGFQSSVDPRINIGVGSATKVDVKIHWPNGQTTLKSSIDVNQHILVNQTESEFYNDTSDQKIRAFESPISLFGEFHT